jgi:hypothetical protein
MDSDVLRYLADLSMVRQQINNILGIARGVIAQDVMHRVSSKSLKLDKLFVDVLLTGKVPGQQNPIAQIEDDDIDITQRLKEAKAELASKNSSGSEEVIVPKPRKKPRKKVDSDQSLEKPQDEVDAFAQLLASAESQVSKKEIPKKKTTKKTSSRRGRKTVK